MGSGSARVILTLGVALTAGYPALAQTAPRFDDAASFVVLGNGSVTNSGATQITGNVRIRKEHTLVASR